MVPGEFPGLEVVDDGAEPAGFGVDDGVLVLGLDQGDPGRGLAVVLELGVEVRQAVLDGSQAPGELAGELARVEDHGERQGGGEGGVLAARGGEHVAQPAQPGAAAFLGQLVDGALGVLPGALGLADGDEPRLVQPPDGLVEVGPLADVDDLVLAPALDEPLHAVGVQRPGAQQGEHREARR